MVSVDPTIAWIVRVAIAALLIGAALPKLQNRAEFAATIENYRVVPVGLTGVTATILPLVELALGLAVLVNAWALVGAAALLMLYAGVVALNLMRGRDHIDCGCHFLGQRGGAIDRAMVVRNLFLAAASLIIVLIPAGSRTPGAVDMLSVGASLVVFGLLYAAFEQARINHAHALRRARGEASI